MNELLYLPCLQGMSSDRNSNDAEISQCACTLVGCTLAGTPCSSQQKRRQGHALAPDPMPMQARQNTTCDLNGPSKMVLLGMEHVIVPRLFVDLFIPIAAVAGILFAVTLWYRVSLIKVRTGQRRSGEDGRTFLLEEELTGEDSVRVLAAWTRSHSLVMDRSYAGCQTLSLQKAPSSSFTSIQQCLVTG